MKQCLHPAGGAGVGWGPMGVRGRRFPVPCVVFLVVEGGDDKCVRPNDHDWLLDCEVKSHKSKGQVRCSPPRNSLQTPCGTLAANGCPAARFVPDLLSIHVLNKEWISRLMSVLMPLSAIFVRTVNGLTPPRPSTDHRTFPRSAVPLETLLAPLPPPTLWRTVHQREEESRGVREVGRAGRVPQPHGCLPGAAGAAGAAG